MKRERLTELLAGIAVARICVIGDLFLDKHAFIDPSLDEPSLETGLAAHQVVYTRKTPGAAGTVLNNLAALGVGAVSVVSMVGDDGEGYEVLRGLNQRGINTDGVIKSADIVTPTYFKPMFIQPNGAAVEGNRLDFKNINETPARLTQALIGLIREASLNADAVIALDQLTDANKGVITDTMRDELAAIANERPALIMYADSRAFIQQFRRMTLKCNDKEAARIVAPDSTGDETFSADITAKALKELEKRAGRPPFISCGANGVMCLQNGEAILVPAARQTGPIDICGAGDACSAGIVSALCAGADNTEAAFMGNLAAGVTVRKLGETGTASPREILALFDEQFGDGCRRPICQKPAWR